MGGFKWKAHTKMGWITYAGLLGICSVMKFAIINNIKVTDKILPISLLVKVRRFIYIVYASYFKNK